MTHPQLLLTAEKKSGLRSLSEVKASLTTGRVKVIWERLQAQADQYLQMPPYVPETVFPGRRTEDAQVGNRDYVIVAAAVTRIKICALSCLLTGDSRFKQDALRQIACVYDDKAWPDWRDMAHPQKPADLRTGQFLRGIGLAYDWLYSTLTPGERAWLVEGLDRRGIQPFFESLELQASWAFAKEPNNWQTCILGGAGIAGMALGEDHPQSRELVEFTVPRFENYLNVLGREGEFNESIGYSGSMQMPIEFFDVHRYWSGGGKNMLLDERFSKFCDWYMYFIAPPGVNVPFGDTHIGAKPNVAMFATMAAATRNPVYRWFYEQYSEPSSRSDFCTELLAYDPSVSFEPPEGKMPRGRGFRDHSACWSSRTDWNPRCTSCVVSGKGGHGHERHGHHDAGTVCIDGYARPLLTEPGNVNYPKDYFGQNRYEYYNAAAYGHNVPVFGGREMRRERDHAVRIPDMAFHDQTGAAWIGDSTALYDGVTRVRRGVIHLLPGVVAVLDACDLAADEETSIRWHTADRCEPDAAGSFLVTNENVKLAGRMVFLGPEPVIFRRGEHSYKPPFDRNRLGFLLGQKHESFVEILLRTRRVRVLSLFCVFGPKHAPSAWEKEDEEGSWTIALPGGIIEVNVSDSRLSVHGSGKAINLDLDAGTTTIQP